MRTLLGMAARFPYAMLALLALALTAAGTWSTDVIRMEGLIANGAQSMARTHEYCVPTVYGEVYAYKPPLAYWLALVSSSVSGSTSGTALRVPFGLCALLLSFVLALTVGRHASRQAGWIAGFASIGGILFTSKLGMATFDVPLALGLAVAACSASLALVSESPRGWLWPLAYAGLALAVLAKGPIALGFFVPGLLGSALLTGRFRRLFSWWHALGILGFGALVGAWVYCAYRSVGPDAFQQASSEARLRLFDWRWDSLAMLPARPLLGLLFFFPWSLVLFLRAPRGAKGVERPTEALLLRAAWGHLLGGVLLLHTIATFEARYFLALSGPLAMVVGLTAGRFLSGTAEVSALQRRVLVFLSATTGLGLAALGVQWVVALPGSYRMVAIAVGLASAALAFEWRTPKWQPKQWALARLCAISLALATLQIFYLRPHKAIARSERGLAQRVAPYIPAGEEVWTDFRDAHSSFFFYLQHPVRTFYRLGQPPSNAWVFVDAQHWVAPPWPYVPVASFEHAGRPFRLLKSL